MHTLSTAIVPLLADPQTADLLAKGGLLKGIGKLLMFGLLLLVILGLVIAFLVGKRARRR